MSPILLALVVTGLHFTLTLAVLVFGTGGVSTRGEAGLPFTLYDRCVLGLLRALLFPFHQITNRYPGVLARTGWPYEHLLLLANSAVWGIAAGVAVWLL